MVKINTGILTMLLLAPAVNAGNMTNVTLPGGEMQFQGRIIAESCTVETGSRDFTVTLGQVRTNQFNYVGEYTNATPFVINLTDCNPDVSRTVGIMFQGVQDGKDPEVLSVGEGPSIASGLGIAIFDAQNRVVPVNAISSSWVTLQSQQETLHFIAKYKSTGHEVVGGKASAQSWFTLTYP